ncbi:MAG: GNAT family N-acetyltransferase [Pseudomonadales bacterium]
MDIIIRHAEPNDYQALHLIYSQPIACAGTLQLPYVSAEVWKKRLADDCPEGSFHLVACVQQEVVGSIGVFIIGYSLRRRHAASFGMGVHDEWQNKGVGSELMKAAIDLADNWLNVMRLELTVYTDNKPAVKLYERFGFVTEGTLEKYAFRDGQYVDAYSMARIKSSQLE